MTAPRAVVVTIAVAAVLATLIGCAPDWAMSVRNATETDWFIRIQSGGDATGEYWVTEVPAGAEGQAATWSGVRDRRIELLDTECKVVGVFETSDGTNYFVAGVAGVTGTIDQWARPTPSPALSGVPRIDPVRLSSRCGGFVWA